MVGCAEREIEENYTVSEEISLWPFAVILLSKARVRKESAHTSPTSSARRHDFLAVQPGRSFPRGAGDEDRPRVIFERGSTMPEIPPTSGDRLERSRATAVSGGSRFPVSFPPSFFAYLCAFPFPASSSLKCSSSFLVPSFNCQFSSSSSLRLLLAMRAARSSILGSHTYTHAYTHARACVLAIDTNQTHLA